VSGLKRRQYARGARPPRQVINSEWKEKDVLLDRIFKDMNASVRAINHELLPFCLVILGGSGCWEEPALCTK
jgi:hypothetical protein